MGEKNMLEKASRKLSYYLRHCKDPLYVQLNGGWASVDIMLRLLGVSREQLSTIVATDSKGRYSYDATGTRIRANQGHSIPGVQIEMEKPEPPTLLYHGTATRFLDAILRDGLKPMSRQWVHISNDYATAVTVGSRHGKPIVLAFRAKDFVADGNELYQSFNGVWQARAVPAKYLSIFYPSENGSGEVFE